NNLVNLADIYRMLGMVEKAEACVQRALELRPGHKSAELISRTLAELKAEMN
ncbi:MAG: tetratricopeptide repeat protein, partial [Leptospiraceae bacterium]|nr:tetratricopeptide repeat protein [Leptospiraceae bacterium]